MANANLIREALMALLKAKKSNTSAQAIKNHTKKHGFNDFDDSSPYNSDAWELADDAAGNLQKARQGAREAQGTDPLASPIDMEDFGNTQLNRDPRNPMNTWHDGDRAPVEFHRRTENISSPNLTAPLGGLSRAEGNIGSRKAIEDARLKATQKFQHPDAASMPTTKYSEADFYPTRYEKLPPEIAQQLKEIEEDIGKGAGLKEVLDRLSKLDEAGYDKYTDDIIDRLLSQTKTPDIDDIPF
jgi:hypothetical protein